MISFLLVSLLAVVPFDHSDWNQFLKKFVNEKGEVNYSAVKKDPKLLNSYLAKLKNISSQEFIQWPREEQIAIFINAYNSGVIKLVLNHYPVRTVMNIPGFWEQQSVELSTYKQGAQGEPNVYSLNEIENVVLKKRFRDEKILFALSKGAKGSPRLQQEAFTGTHLEGQLYLATQEFVNNPKQNQIEPGGKKLYLSRLFQWYGNDFLLNWGDFPEEKKWNPQEMAVLSFFAHYLQDSKKVEYLKEGEYKVRYSSFDWQLNDWLPAAGQTKS